MTTNLKLNDVQNVIHLNNYGENIQLHNSHILDTNKQIKHSPIQNLHKIINT